MRILNSIDSFARRHIGPNAEDCRQMLDLLGFSRMDDFIEQTIPAGIRQKEPLAIGSGQSEYSALAALRQLALRNKVFRSYIGMGYHDCVTPPVIQRNIFENPGWYTHYTPYQPEISQGRLEALLNFQTVIKDLTGLEIANASLLDEGTAAAEAMRMSYSLSESNATVYFVSETCHPQTIAVVQTRGQAQGIEVVVGNHETYDFSRPTFGALLQCPASDGSVYDYSGFISKAHKAGVLVTVAADLLSLTLIQPPGEFDADIAVGSAQRFGVPLGYGGPHAAYFATREAYKRAVPGRLVGISKDAQGKTALRLALQTREQHIRREKATSNICTSQVLLAVMAGMYAVYHGPTGLRDIALRIHLLTALLHEGLKRLGYSVEPESFFDTVRVKLSVKSINAIQRAASAHEINLRWFEDNSAGISLDETTALEDVRELLSIFNDEKPLPFALEDLANETAPVIPDDLTRKSSYLTHAVFNSYNSETEMMRYMHRLECKDLSLNASMIPLGSCTMKLNAAAEMFPISWPQFSKIHPFAPLEQTKGYQALFQQLEAWLANITGFSAVSFQPNAGSQGEFTGLLVIRKYHAELGQSQRNICFIPHSAHGTNPASAILAGLKVVEIECNEQGNIDLSDLKAKAEKHKNNLACLMITYPSTHGVFEEEIFEICSTIHACGGQVYMDGANLNAMVGLSRPAEIGADVCHMNLHKTFCIPHGGGGPGMGPIAVKGHLVCFLPRHPIVGTGGEKGIGPVSSAPWGSPSILPISWIYISLMGSQGLADATKVAILNANYIAKRLEAYYPIVYRGANGFVAHECILDLRGLKKSAGIEVDDIAKRLMDYGFHAPTVSFPVAGTIMVEPTESESRQELDRFCQSMIAIRAEIAEIEAGKMSQTDNMLKNAPHTAEALLANEWQHPYSREQAAFPLPWTREFKFWPSVGRIDNVYGDRHFFCSCQS
jgi:glycine dehydrogenase